MTTNDEIFVALKNAVRVRITEQLSRHARAGVQPNRSMAFDMAITQERERLLQMATDADKNGKEDFADALRDLAHCLPELIKELGISK